MTEGTILLVEDNEDDELLTLRAFKSAGIANEVAVVRDGAQALDYLFATGAYAGLDKRALPLLILLDLNLPKIGGLEVLKRVRHDERTKLLSVVILTSSKEEEDIVRSYSLGANSYVRKPVAFAEFALAVKAVGHYWLLLNQPPPRLTS